MSQFYDTRIKMKKDTEDNWTQSNPLLLDGELILVNTSDGKTKIKIGNGTDTYTNLSFLTLENESSQQDNCPFPINSLFIGVDTTNPSTYWPSTTWQLFGQGKTLIGLDAEDTDYNTALKTGGAKTISLSHTHSTSGHALTTSEMPSHSHSFGSHTHNMTHTHDDTFSVRSHSHTMNHGHNHNITGGRAGDHTHDVTYGGYHLALDGDGGNSGYTVRWSSQSTLPYNGKKFITTTTGGHNHTTVGGVFDYSGSTGSASPSISGSVSQYSGSTGTASGSSGSAGSGSSHNHGDTGSALGSQSIVQSYITVCFWLRTA